MKLKELWRKLELFLEGLHRFLYGFLEEIED